MRNVVSSWTRFRQSLPVILAALKGGSSYPLDRLNQLELELAEVKSALCKSQPDRGVGTL